MRDIGYDLSTIMRDKKCSSMSALFLLQEAEDSGIHKLQSKSDKKIGRRLCYSCRIKNTK